MPSDQAVQPLGDEARTLLGYEQALRGEGLSLEQFAAQMEPPLAEIERES